MGSLDMVFWDVTLCRMEGRYPPKKYIPTYQTRRHNILEDSNLNSIISKLSPLPKYLKAFFCIISILLSIVKLIGKTSDKKLI
jgi:hypothetical protein